MNNLVATDAYAKLIEEIQQLKQILAFLTEERDDLLYHICPELAARYARNIGDYLNRINYQKIMILEMKRRIEIARAALNREKAISQESVDEQIKTEYQQFHYKADEAFRKSEEAKQKQNEREQRQQQYEYQWQQQYGKRAQKQSSEEAFEADSDTASANSSGSDNSNNSDNPHVDTDTSTSGGKSASADNTELPNAKEMFRKIVKKLHPDMNPDITAREKELFNKAVKAYQDGDINTLQSIYDEVFYAGDADINERNLSLEELSEIRHKLEVRISQLQAEINKIKEAFPYKEKELLDDKDKLDKLRDEMNEDIRHNEETIKHLNEMLREINKEMDNLRQKQDSSFHG